MLVPLYEAVYERLDVGPATRLLSLGCGSGLGLLLAAVRGASVTGVDQDERRLALARARLQPAPRPAHHAHLPPPPTASRAASSNRATSLLCGGPERVTTAPAPAGVSAPRGRFNMITAFELTNAPAPHRPLAAAAALAERSAPVVLAAWGPRERCRANQVLAIARRIAGPDYPVPDPFRLSGPEALEEVAAAAGLRPDGSGRVACPFAYPDLDSAVRGLRSTGLFDTAEQATDRYVLDKELAEALHQFRRRDGSIRMDNVFRYVIARTP